jgi:hypothetical protein
MAALGDAYQNKVLDYLFGGSPATPPATVYVALYTVAPTSAGGGTEVSGFSYARVALTNNTSNFPGASGGSQDNGTAIIFPTATGTWGTVVAFAIHDDPIADSIMVFGAVTPVSVVNTDTPEFTVGALMGNAA